MFKPADYVKELGKVGLATKPTGEIYVKDAAKYAKALHSTTTILPSSASKGSATAKKGGTK